MRVREEQGLQKRFALPQEGAARRPTKGQRKCSAAITLRPSGKENFSADRAKRWDNYFMSDHRKFTMLAGAGVLLVLLVIAYDSILESSLASLLETSKRQRHYEQVIEKKGLSLHEGAFWKTK